MRLRVVSNFFNYSIISVSYLCDFKQKHWIRDHKIDFDCLLVSEQSRTLWQPPLIIIFPNNIKEYRWCQIMKLFKDNHWHIIRSAQYSIIYKKKIQNHNPIWIISLKMITWSKLPPEATKREIISVFLFFVRNWIWPLSGMKLIHSSVFLIYCFIEQRDQKTSIFS